MPDEKTPDPTEERSSPSPRVRTAARDARGSAGQTLLSTQIERGQLEELAEVTGENGETKHRKPERHTELMLVEIWHSNRKVVTEILGDLFVTVVILGSLQFIHIFVGALSLPELIKVLINGIHDYGTLIVLLVLTLAFILRMAERLRRKKTDDS